MRINTNLTALNTFNSYSAANNKIASSVAKLSSGYAINSAADNAAGLAISEKMRSQIRGLDRASSNSQDAISLVQTGEGALSSAGEILQRMREISVQSASDTNENEIDRDALQSEFSQLQKELNEISKNTSFNKKTLLDGSLAQETAKLSNVSLAQSGLSVELGDAAAGSYNFSVGVQQESAAIAGHASTFTATSSNSTFATSSSVNNSLGESSLANGNYTVKAAYDTDNKQMTFTATGDNGQTFTATLSNSDLASSFGAGAAATLTFKNGSTTAFSFTVTPTATYDTTNASTMGTLASDLSSALKLSATGGVDAQEATYGVYASLTGAESVKLEAGAESVSFGNGVKVNFNKLATSSVSTNNTATLAGAASLTGVSSAAADTDAFTAKLENFKALDTYAGTFGTAGTDKLTAVTTDLTTDNTMTVTIGGKDYTAALTTAQANAALSFANTDVANTTKSLNLTFKDANGVDAFTMDVTTKLTAQDTGSDDATPANDITEASLTASSLTVGLTNAGGHTFDATFGTTASQFDVNDEVGAGLTFQVGANQGDEMTIYIDKMDSNYLGVASADVSTQTGASAAIGVVDKAISKVSSQRSYLGAIQNRLDYKISNLETSSQNLTSAESQIRDVDMAKEMTNFTNANILAKASTAMLAQANALPQNVLSLLG